MREFFAAVALGLAAYWLARGVGIPSWRSWEPGDATDIGFLVWGAVLLLAKPS